MEIKLNGRHFPGPLNKTQSNLPEEEKEALKEIIYRQWRGDIKVVPNDITGGVTVVDLQDYIAVVNEQLEVTYEAEDGTIQTYFRWMCFQHLKNLGAKGEELVNEGVQEGWIHKDDAKEMVVYDIKPGRYYGLAKVHKNRTVWPKIAGGRCPPLRPVNSCNGTISEGISHWVDEQAKEVVTRLPTFLEDMRHMP